MKYFDLHCDTATKIFEKNLDLSDESLHINYKTIAGFEKCYQLCAVFTDDTEELKGMDYFVSVVTNFSQKIKIAENFVPIFSIEGGGIIEGDPKNLDILKAFGVRVFGFSWNGKNQLAAGNFYDKKSPLTAAGLDVLKRLGELDIVPDISHLSDRGVFDIMINSTKPFIATHSNSRKVCGHPRNCTDEQLSEIYRRGGLSGLNLFKESIGGNATLDDLMRHIDHMLSLGGENFICLGGDWDGTTTPTEVGNLSGIKNIYKKIAVTFSEQLAEKITFTNAYNFFYTNGNSVK